MVEHTWRHSVAAATRRLREEMMLRKVVVLLRRLALRCLGLHSLGEGPGGVYEVSASLVDLRPHPLRSHIIRIRILIV